MKEWRVLLPDSATKSNLVFRITPSVSLMEKIVTDELWADAAYEIALILLWDLRRIQ